MSTTPNPETAIVQLPQVVRKAQLHTIDLFKLQQGSDQEHQRLLDASTRDGFFYLNMTHDSFEPLMSTVNQIHHLSKELFNYSAAEKAMFDVDLISPKKLNGYKPKGRNIVSRDGDRDGFESWVLPRNGIMQLELEGFPHPPVVSDYMMELRRLTSDLGRISHTIFSALSQMLCLKPGKCFQDFHDQSQPTPDILRLLKYHANTKPLGVPQTPHTDLGSLTFVFSNVPGLQVLPANTPEPPQESDWVFVAPIVGHAVVNLGDCMSMMTNGKLKSALHRVGPLPNTAMPERFSFAYLMRPAPSTLLEILDSPVIEKLPGDRCKEIGKPVTSEEWISRKFKALRAGQGKGHVDRDGENILTGGRGVMVSMSREAVFHQLCA
ncbi:putative oxidoreductase [Stachybotrys elegans]|uniref:Oxidoreductase n=1 Tax=Stachybotrys elegans TaxID=80388 RepID=A0A8K0SK13_9HYPO|nr:putative oxidoreductase [Stachybotrys elegans]